MSSETRSVFSGLAGFRGLSTPVKIMLFGSLVNRFGNGIIAPFTVVYLHNSVGLGLALTGTLLGLFGFTGLAFTPVAGIMVDRVGNRWTMALALVLLAIGYGGLALVNGAVSAAVVLIVAGAGNGMFWPSFKALLASLTPPGRRHIAVSFEQIAGNIGLGVGALLGSVMIGLESASRSYSVLFILDAATFILFLALLPRTIAPDDSNADGAAGDADEHAQSDGEDRDVGWGAVLRNRAMRRLLVVQLLIVMFGIVTTDQMLPVYLKNFGGVPGALLGLVLAVNTGVYILVQLPMIRLLEGRRRAVSLAWGLASQGVLWLVITIITGVASGLLVLVIACVVSALYTFGESIVSIVVDPTVGDIAPPHLMGRFMSALTLMWNIGLIASPIICGAIMQVYPHALWPVVAAAMFLAALLARRLQDDLPKSRQLIESG